MIQQIFSQLHQTQIALIQSPNKHTVNDYRSKLEEICSRAGRELLNNNSNNEAVKPAFEFLLLPLLSSIKRLNQSEKNQRPNDWCDLNESLLKSITLLIETFQVIDETSLFNDVLNAASIVLSRLDTDNKKSFSDELMSACCRLISVVFNHCTTHIYDDFVKFSSLTTIGLLVAKLLDILIDSSSLQVRLDSLNAFTSVLVKDCDGYTDRNHRIGLIYASFLPGISIKLVQKFFLAQNLKLVNHKLICASLNSLQLVLSSVFDDYLLDDGQFRRCFDSCLDSESTKRREEITAMIVNRAEKKSWLSESSEKVFYLVDRLLDVLVSHDNEQVKLALIEFCSNVADRCYVSLNAYLDKLLKVLVTCAVDSGQDDSSLVVLRATQAIEKLENKETVNTTSYKIIHPNRFSIVSSSIQELLLKLPRLMSKTDVNSELSDESRIGYLRTVYGYLRLIGRRRSDFSPSQDHHLASFFLTNLTNLSQFLDALVNCVKFDYSSLTNFYEVHNVASSDGLSNYKGLETYLHDRCVLAQLKAICAYLGQSDAARLVIDQLLNSDLTLLENRRFKLEALFLINLVLLGLEKRDKSDNDENEEKVSIVNMVLSRQFADFKSQSESKSTSDLIETLDLNENKTTARNRMILQICLTLEVISTTSRFFRPTKKDEQQEKKVNSSLLFLIDNLYFTLENYLSPNVLIKCVAKRSLDTLAQNAGYSSPRALLSANYDLLMNDLVLKSSALNRNRKQRGGNDDEHSSHVEVLCALIRVSDADLCPHLERLVDDYIFSAQLNPNNSSLIKAVCRILMFMAQAMRVWYPVKFNFVAASPSSGGEQEENSYNYDLSILNLAEFVRHSKRREDEKKSFVEILREVDAQFAKSQKDREDLERNLYKDDTFSKDQKEDTQMREEDNQEEETEKREKPLEVKLQTKCLELCTHLISHPNREIRLRAIDLTRELSKNLAEHTNDYLPLVHKLWSPICQRFSLDDLVVKARILFALFDLCLLSGDFLAQRFIKEFLPRIGTFMRDQAKHSVNCSKDTTYIYSQAFKLQCAVLVNIDKICVCMEVREAQLEQLIDSIVLVYLDKRQPKRLQLLAIDALRHFALVDADTVWLCLIYVLPFQSLRGDVYERAVEMFKCASMKLPYPKFDQLQIADDMVVDLLDLFNTI